MVDPDRFVNEWERYLQTIRSAGNLTLATPTADVESRGELCGLVVRCLPSMEVLDAAHVLSSQARPASRGNTGPAGDAGALHDKKCEVTGIRNVTRKSTDK